MAMELRVLGSVTLASASSEVPAGQPTQCAVLAVLAVDAGRLVPVDALLERVWGADPPPRARRTLHTYLARIRRLLEAAGADDPAPVRLLHRQGGYLLEVVPERVDLHRYRRLLADARDPASDAAARLDLLRAALGLWRGEPLAGVPGDWAARRRDAWRHQHLDAVIAWAQAELDAGQPGAALDQLAVAAAEHPLVEPLIAVWMRILYATGRGAEALASYAATRQRLVDELGAEPGAELGAIHQAILRNEPAGPPAARPGRTRATAPAQLPADVPGFAGRARQLSSLDSLLDEPSRPLRVALVTGTAGVGKTALAVHWAHRVRARFPDGQLYVDLRGYDPSGPATSPDEAILGFLLALGVAPDRIPPGLDARAALYRTELDGRRMLLLLDNARDAGQVRPLLPAGPAAMALVTSREQLPGLVAAGALPQVLDVLTADEARELLARRLGPDAVAEPDDAVRRVVAACAGLPLALTIVAARVTLSGFPLRALAAELADSRSRLDALDTGDPGRELRAVLGMSYSSLDPPAARLFRLFGLHPGPDVSAAAAASLGGLPPRRARSLLAALARASLLTEPVPGRFAFHDLLRAYATDLTLATDPDREREAAVDRMLDHCLHTALSACRLLDPHRGPPLVTAGPPRSGVHVACLADRAEAQAWFDAERPALLAALRRSAGGPDERRTWLLAWALDPHLYWRGHWEEHAGSWRIGIEAAGRLGDHRLLAQSHRNLARALIRQGDYGAAGDHLDRALVHSGLACDPAGQAGCHEQLAYLCERDGRFHDALDHARTAHLLYVGADHRRGQADALNSVGWYHALLDRHELALTCCERALGLHDELGDLEGQAADLDRLGYAHRHLGHHRQATEVYRQAIALYERLGDQYNRAWSHRRLGDAHQAAGDLTAARSSWRHAYDLFTTLGHRDADSVPHGGR